MCVPSSCTRYIPYNNFSVDASARVNICPLSFLRDLSGRRAGGFIGRFTTKKATLLSCTVSSSRYHARGSQV